jgi:hypothetical protein
MGRRCLTQFNTYQIFAARHSANSGENIMAFVNEHIPEEDIKKYEIAKWDEKFLKGHYQPSWTVDRVHDIYLRYMSCGREESSNRWTFCFYWKGHVLSVEVDVSGGEAVNGVLPRTYSLVGLTIPLFDPLPNQLLGSRDHLLEDLKAALVGFGDYGVHSIWAGPLSISFRF